MKRILKSVVLFACAISLGSCGMVHKVFCGDSCSANKSKKTTEVAEANTGEEEIIACQLSDGDLAKRKDDLKKVITSKLIKHEELKNGFILHFPYEQELNQQILDYVMAENECCPFLTFELKLKSMDNVELKITGPKLAKSIIRDAIFS